MIECPLDRLGNAILVSLPDGPVVVVMFLLEMIATLVRYALEPEDLCVVLPVRVESADVLLL